MEFLCFPLVSFFLMVSCLGCMTGTVAVDDSTLVGAIVDTKSRKGKEEIVAMKIAMDKFNNNSKTHKLSLIVRDFNGELAQAALISWSFLLLLLHLTRLFTL